MRLFRWLPLVWGCQTDSHPVVSVNEHPSDLLPHWVGVGEPDLPEVPVEIDGDFSTLPDLSCDVEPAAVQTDWGDCTFTQVEAGTGWACGILTGGRLACWGYGTTDEGLARVPAGHFKQLAQKADVHPCALRQDGCIRCWMFSGTEESFDWISDYPGGKYSFIATSGIMNGCVLDEKGKADCWGYDGLSDDAIQGGWHLTRAPDDSFQQVAVNEYYSCGLRIDGTVTCWGLDHELPVWDSDPTNGAVGEEPSGNFTSITGGANSMCALAADGAATCWGTRDFTTPAQAGNVDELWTGPFSAISVGTPYSSDYCGITTAGDLECSSSDTPWPEPSSRKYVQISVGSKTVCALDTDQHAHCWSYWHETYIGNAYFRPPCDESADTGG